MKNLLFLGAVALLLFSLSAALSLWLNQSKQEAAQAEKDKAEAKDNKAIPKGGPTPEAPKDKEPEKKIPPISPPTVNTPEAGLKDQKDALDRKALQISLVLADVQAQREATDALLRQVTTELKNAPKTPAPDPNEMQLKKDREEALKAERANLVKLAQIFDAMTPEGAAPHIKSIAESGPGKLEQAAQILVLMKDRNSARLLEELRDPALGAQLMDKIRLLRTQNATFATAPAPAPAPAPSTLPSGVRPAGAP